MRQEVMLDSSRKELLIERTLIGAGWITNGKAKDG
jgi:hypothetical protein